ncbi:MAG: helix-turn-helix transcriptional regulator [Hespellia sp.]|jgi:transcriptional regulator with XRE-family HTH domain|nr:helix-turn-helix transcriptional regulator [Hespellia sp.]
MTNIQLSKNLRFKRKEYGLTQERLGELLNISRQAYSNYEIGNRTPDLDTLFRLCQIYHLTLDELVNQNLENRIAEHKGPYQFACEISSGTTLYLSKDEVDFIMQYRNMSKEDRLLLKKFMH